MKNNFFKKLMMPLATLVLGVVGAFATSSMGSTKVLADTRGYENISFQDPCHQSVMCSTSGTAACTNSSSVVLWGKTNEADATCPLTIYKK